VVHPKGIIFRVSCDFLALLIFYTTVVVAKGKLNEADKGQTLKWPNEIRDFSLSSWWLRSCKICFVPKRI